MAATRDFVPCDYCDAPATGCLTCGDLKTRRVYCAAHSSNAILQKGGRFDWSYAPGFGDVAWKRYRNLCAFQAALRRVRDAALRLRGAA